jgi:hypothetical protein
MIYTKSTTGYLQKVRNLVAFCAKLWAWANIKFLHMVNHENYSL